MKIGSFHRLDLFDDGHLPTTDEHQLFTWFVHTIHNISHSEFACRKDANLKEVLTTLRIISPQLAEIRHPLARFSFKTVYADPQNRGRFTQKDIGAIHSREILGEAGSLDSAAPRLLEAPQPPGRLQESMEGVTTESSGKDRSNNLTLDDLRFVPGDYLLISVILPKSANVPADIAIKGSAAQTWKATPKGDNGWGGGLGAAASSAPPGRGGGGGAHWRGGPDSGPPGRGRGVGRGGGDRDRGSDRDRGAERDIRDRGGDREKDRLDRDRDYRRPRDSGRGRGRRSSRTRSPRSGTRSPPSRSRSRSRSPRRRRYRD